MLAKLGGSGQIYLLYIYIYTEYKYIYIYIYYVFFCALPGELCASLFVT